MATFSAPTAPAFEDALLPFPPKYKEGQEEKYLKQVDKFFGSIFHTFNDLNMSIKNGWLVKDARIVALTADKILANSIFTQFLTVGANENIEIDGVNQFISVTDDNGTLRGKFGKTGSGNSNWGLDLWDSAGSLVFSVADTTFINGAIIQNATITDSKIDGMSTSKLIGLVNDAQLNSISATKITGQVVNTQIANIQWAKITGVAITNADILSLSASKINTGTLTVDGNPAIQVTSGGAVNFFNGADIHMRASSSGNTNYLAFQTSGGATRGYLSLTSIGNIRLQGISTDLELQADGAINIDPGTSMTILSSVTIAGTLTSRSIIPSTDSLYSLGSSGNRYADAWLDDAHIADSAHVGDIAFQNDWILTEADKVYEVEGKEGMVLLNHRKTPMMVIDKYGNLYTKGKIKNIREFKGERKT